MGNTYIFIQNKVGVFHLQWKRESNFSFHLTYIVYFVYLTDCPSYGVCLCLECFLLPTFSIYLQAYGMASAVENLQGSVLPVILDFLPQTKDFYTEACFEHRFLLPSSYFQESCCHLSVPTTVATIQGISQAFNVQAMLSAKDWVSEAPNITVT